MRSGRRNPNDRRRTDRALATHLEVLAGMHEDFEKRVDERFETLAATHADFEKRMTDYTNDVKDAIQRLTVISAANTDTLDDHEQRIE